MAEPDNPISIPSVPTFGPTGAPCKGQKFPGGEYTLDGCLASYGGTCVQKLPEEAHTLAPWVAMTFEGSGSTITVGNNSSPSTNPQNVACIKSFEFGYSDGLTLRCTIQDEQGGSFVQFMQNLLKDYACLKNGSPASVRMKVQFGWCKAGCGTPIPPAASRCYYCLSDAVETNFSGGKFNFEVTGKDLCYKMFEGGAQTADGGEGENGIPITEAIRKFMTQGPPPNLASVRFLRMEGGKAIECPFKTNGLAGPKGKWTASGQDKLQVVLRWISGHMTDKDRSWIPQYNSENPGGELILWEDSKVKQVEGDKYWDDNCIGTYIVNGGKRSPVIEFNPKIRWDFSRLTSAGGAMGDGELNPMGTPGASNPGTDGVPSEKAPGAGHMMQTTGTETHKDNGGKPIKEKNQADAEQMRALKILHDNIEADLTIVGDPTILPPSEAMWAKNLTIILVNPYHLRRSSLDATSELDWLANPVCNEVLSSKAWICKSVSHRIEAGNYTTTIGIYLIAPGIDAPAGTPLGNWTNGWQPAPQC
jgi:hypothetical protein